MASKVGSVRPSKEEQRCGRSVLRRSTKPRDGRNHSESAIIRSMSDLSSRQAAEVLGVNEQRLRVLAASGRLPARKVGRAWIIDSSHLPDPGDRRGPGRPLSAGNAWGLLALLSGEVPGWVDPSVRSRLRRRAKDPSQLILSLRSSQPRSRVFSFRFLPVDLDRLRARRGLVLAGLSADHPSIDMRARSDELDAYVDEDALRRIVKEYRPISEPKQANAILRIPSRNWVLDRDGSSPLAVVAADLLADADPRARRSAEQALRALAT